MVESGHADVIVVPLRNSGIVDTDPVRGLVHRACERVPVEPAGVLDWLRDHAKDESVVILIAVAGGQLCGLVIVMDWISAFATLPQVGHFYAEPGAKGPLVRAAIEWIRDRGYDRCLGMNHPGISDEKWQAFWPRPMKRIASVFEFDLSGE